MSRCEISICLVKRMLDNMLLQLVQASLEEAQFEKKYVKITDVEECACTHETVVTPQLTPSKSPN